MRYSTVTGLPFIAKKNKRSISDFVLGGSLV